MTTPLSQSVDTLAGRTSTAPFITLIMDRAPTGNDGVSQGYLVGQRWVDTAADNQEYFLLGFTASNGIIQSNWVLLGGGGATVETLTGNSGGAVSPNGSNNINVVGDGIGINIVGTPSTNTLTASLVGTGGGAPVLGLIGNDSVRVVPNSAGNIHTVGTGSITTVGTTNTETIELTGLTNHAVLVGAGTATITKVGPSSSTGAPLISAGSASDPVFSTTMTITDASGSMSQVSAQSGTRVVWGLSNSDNTSTSSAAAISIDSGPGSTGGSVGDCYVECSNHATPYTWQFGQRATDNSFTIQGGTNAVSHNMNQSVYLLINTSGAVTTTGSLSVAGDTGGSASETTFTSTAATSVSTGTGTIKMTTGNNANSLAWIKIYIGTTAYYIPCFTSDAP